MNNEFNNKYAAKSANQMIDIRRDELKNQSWNRAKAQLLADDEGIDLSNDHWAILSYLRKRYLVLGLPRHARHLSSILSDKYASKGGNKYLRRLFPGGPVTQGSRFANLHTPPDATDASHGINY
jgi:tRNA 2-thiouridine synthesizing protein E